MGPRREASQAADGRGVPGPEGVFDFEEEAQEEPQGLICTLMAPLRSGVDWSRDCFSRDGGLITR